MEKEDLIEYYNDLCRLSNKNILARNEYRNLSPKYSTDLIERAFGTWKNFTKEANRLSLYKRTEKKVFVPKNVDKVVISYIPDGESNIDFSCLNTLKNYCRINNAKLYLLWGRETSKNKVFRACDYNYIKDYLVTSIRFEKDKSCFVEDFLIKHTQKNPLLNIEKIAIAKRTVIVGGCKQAMKILPYKQFDPYRIACSTGTIAYPDYENTINGGIDSNLHTFGGILLTYNEKEKRYVVRNLQYTGVLYDMNRVYTETGVIDIKSCPALILGDLHLPEEDQIALKNTKELMHKINPRQVIIHDVASWNSISHHEKNQHFTKIKNTTKETISLKTELEEVKSRLKVFTKEFSNTTFNIVNSNHDDFVIKWLNDGDFIKDSINARCGAELFIKYLDNKNILTDELPSNVRYLKKNKSFKIYDFELSEHGDSGISGGSASLTTFSKSFEKSVTGHTHSPEFLGKNVIVGTLSKLKLNYNQKGLTKWAHCNCIIHENSTFQMIFV